MTVVSIRKLGDPALREPAKPVTDFDAELHTLVGDLRETLSDSRGAGLAAPQLGVGLRVFVWSPKLIDGRGDLDHLVNPVLDFPDEEEQDGMEGCLSIPGVFLDTKRRMNVVAKGFTMKGDPVQVVGDGILARCIQHETDHLDGVLFIDRLTPEQQERWIATLRAADWFDESLMTKIKNSPHQ
ncbi:MULTISPECIES: peptide deformylase [Streptomyces]|uniref:Peptide deformylase n=2 Tax=Streptomyces TaxID=1883 RepID=A0ABV9J567_9ACTN